ncbi:MAG: hypothetical protein IIU16_05340, partial [Bacteroidales bacterium]|nr:hypothetical protein [Bacteroidales bacterium]
ADADDQRVRNLHSAQALLAGKHSLADVEDRPVQDEHHAHARAYEYARAGEAVELKSSLITIEKAHLDDFKTGTSGRPVATVTLRCSKGTYIRSFARDLGLAVGSGAHLTALRRTLSGDFEINNAIDLDFLVSSNNFVG